MTKITLTNNLSFFKNFLLLFIGTVGYSQTVINLETFESNFGIWKEGSANVTREITAPYQGTTSIRFRGTTNMTLSSSATGIDISPYNKIDIKFFVRTKVSSGETITLQYKSTNSASWQDVKIIEKGSGAPGSGTARDININDEYHAFYATLFSTDYNFTTTSQFRFVANIGTNNRYFYLDNVSIIGTVYNTITKGPGGITANLETWLRADKVNGSGTVANNAVVNTWEDVGKGNDAKVIDETNISLTNRPIYKNNSASNLNFNPVVFFNNNNINTVSDLTGLSNTSEMNGTGGFYTNEQFIVFINDSPIKTNNSSIFSGIYCSQKESAKDYSTDATGFGLGSYTSRFLNEIITYAIGDNPNPNPSKISDRGYGIAQTGLLNYDNLTAILNARNLISVPNINGMELYKDGVKIDDTEVGVPQFQNSKNKRFWLGRTQAFNGSFGGRIAEVISYSARKNDVSERRKIESYLALKYGITLGVNGTTLNYENSNGNIVWNATTNTGYNFDIAGIFRDDSSQHNQKQSKSINSTEVMTIGLGDILNTNSDNTNTFATDKSYLVWGANGGNMNNSGSNLKIDLGPTTISTITEVVNRKWKVVETGGDVAASRVSVPTSTFASGLPALGATDAYVMVVATNADFTTGLETVFMSSTGTNQTCLYDFDGTKYITFGVAHRATNPLHITLDGIDDFVKIDNVNEIGNNFSIMTWVRPNGANTSRDERTVLGKTTTTNGYKLVLQSDNKVRMEWTVTGTTYATITNTVLPNAIWHNIVVTYGSNTINIYIDGVLDKTATITVAPANTMSTFSIGGQYINKSIINNLWRGDIDEIRMWNRVVTPTEIRFIMNQEIEQIVTTTDTKGTIIPMTVTKNDISGLLWNNLFAYYSMNSYIGTHLDDDSLNTNRGSLVIPDKISINVQTAPMPYVSSANGLWSSSTSWKNGAIQDLPYSLSIVDNTTPIAWNIVKTNHNITSQGNKTLLGLFVNSNTLTATTSGGLQTDGTKIEVSHYLKLDGKIDLVGRSQLIQTLNSDLDPTSKGSLERDQQGQGNKFNYNYWGSPVGHIELNKNSYTVKGVIKDGTNPASPGEILWVDGYNGSLSPFSLARFWINKFDSNLNAIDYANWTQIGESGILEAGKGFTLKGAGTSGTQNLVFRGRPNNGDIENIVGSDQLLLVGNPYPSAIDADQFITDNIGSIRTSVVDATIDGALYFWEHYSSNNTHNLGGYEGGYAIRNLSGGVAPSATGVDFISGSGTALKLAPEQFIPVGQGFFVIGKLGSGGPVKFNNGQRAFVRENDSTSQSIYRTIKKSKAISHWTDNSSTIIPLDTYKRIRLGFNVYSEPFHRQALLAFMDDKADSQINDGYDAYNIDDAQSDMYLLNGENELAIQGEGYFDESASFPIGVRLETAGKVSFGIDDLENFDTNQSFYIHDAKTDSYHSIKEGLYEVELEEGIVNNRFSLRFKDKTLGVNSPIYENQIAIHYSQLNKVLYIYNNTKDNTVETAALYDIQGKEMKNWNVEEKEQTKIKLQVNTMSSGIYIVKLKTTKGNVSKKIIIR